MRRRKVREQLGLADRLAEEVALYVREHDHPIRDGSKLKLDYQAMVEAIHAYFGTDLTRPQPSRPPFMKRR